jgi:hypothetical protein
VNGASCRRNPDNCLDDARTVTTIAKYAGMGLPTHVIGIGDDTDAQFVGVLDEMALAGGRPLTGGAHSYYAASSPGDLQAALVAIRDQVGACAFLTTSVPTQMGTIVVTANGAIVPFDPSGTNGWTWGDEANGEILLHGAACNAALGGGASGLVAHVTCATEIDAGDASPR